MKKQKPDLLSESEFTKLNIHKKKHHYPLPNEIIPEDENIDSLEETLIGMEYDVESDEDIDEAIPDEDLDYLLSEGQRESEEEEDDDDNEIEHEEEGPSHETPNAHP